MPSRTPAGWTPQDPSKLSQTAPWLAYVLPYAVFVLLTSLERLLHSTELVYVYPLFYALKIAAVVWVVALVRSRLPELTQKPAGIGQGILFGVVLAVLWVAVDKVSPHFKFLGHRVGFNPTTLHPALLEWAFVAVRLLGLSVVVPIVEETLYRAFLLRYAADPDRWPAVPLGTVTLAGVGLNVAGDGPVAPGMAVGGGICGGDVLSGVAHEKPVGVHRGARGDEPAAGGLCSGDARLAVLVGNQKPRVRVRSIQGDF